MPDTHQWREPAHLDVRPISVTGFRIVDEILARRGFTTPELAQGWLNPDLPRECAQVSLTGMEQVLGRIAQAVRDGQSIRIFGDYDCDGITSTAILYQALSFASPGTVTWELPDRADGYGLRLDVIQRAITDQVGLLVAVDCGSNDLDLIDQARGAGLDVVVIDHHQINVEIPPDAAVVNPQRDESSPLQSLTAAGLAFLVVNCLAREGFAVAPDTSDERIYLDLAAIGTIADVGSLQGLNRAIVLEGIRVLRSTKRLGIKALARHMNVDLARANAETVSFKIAPKLNAPGRMGAPDPALRLLIASDWDTAEEAAKEVMAADLERRTQAEIVTAEVTAKLLLETNLPPVIVVSGEDWSPGVLGPVAAKVAEKHDRPALVLAPAGEHLGGSGRSVGEWDLAAALQQLTHLLVRHGGHARAAGLAIERDRLDELKAALTDLYTRGGHAYGAPPEHVIDADVEDDLVSLDLVRAIERLGPFGSGNERPILRWKGARVSRRSFVGKDETHAQLWLDRGQSHLKAIYFGGAERVRGLSQNARIDVLLELSLGSWREIDQIDARLIDFQSPG